MSKKTISEMIGKIYIYKDEQHVIVKIQPYIDDKVDVTTDKCRTRVTMDELKTLFTPVHVPMLQPDNTSLLMAFKEQAKPMDDLATKLVGIMDKIENDKTFIDQAKAINETARNIILMRKAQIELLKVMKP